MFKKLIFIAFFISISFYVNSYASYKITDSENHFSFFVPDDYESLELDDTDFNLYTLKSNDDNNIITISKISYDESNMTQSDIEDIDKDSSYIVAFDGSSYAFNKNKMYVTSFLKIDDTNVAVSQYYCTDYILSITAFSSFGDEESLKLLNEFNNNISIDSDYLYKLNDKKITNNTKNEENYFKEDSDTSNIAIIVITIIVIALILIAFLVWFIIFKININYKKETKSIASSNNNIKTKVSEASNKESPLNIINYTNNMNTLKESIKQFANQIKELEQEIKELKTGYAKQASSIKKIIDVELDVKKEKLENIKSEKSILDIKLDKLNKVESEELKTVNKKISKVKKDIDELKNGYAKQADSIKAIIDVELSKKNEEIYSLETEKTKIIKNNNFNSNIETEEDKQIIILKNKIKNLKKGYAKQPKAIQKALNLEIAKYTKEIENLQNEVCENNSKNNTIKLDEKQSAKLNKNIKIISIFLSIFILNSTKALISTDAIWFVKLITLSYIILSIVALIGVWKKKKWGVIAYICNIVLSLVLNLILILIVIKPFNASLFIGLISLIGPVILLTAMLFQFKKLK